MFQNIKRYGQNTFSSLSIPNYRRYFFGQLLAISGYFMQSIALVWMVLTLTKSGTALGIVTALQYLPVLFLGPWGGAIADSFSKRKLLIITQATSGLVSLGLAVLIIVGSKLLWPVYLLALILGLTTVVENPSRHTFLSELVSKDSLKNAVTLNVSMINLARFLGPAIAGVVISFRGLFFCFVLSAVSYSIGIFVISLIRTAKPPANFRLVRLGGVRESFRYALSKPSIAISLLMMAIIGTFTYEFPISLALLAKNTFSGNAGSYAALTAAVGAGAIIGGILTAGNKRMDLRLLIMAAFLFGVAVIFSALMPTLILTILLLLLVGAFSISFGSLSLTFVQLESDPEWRGRVMAFFTMAYWGSTAIGGPIIGWIGEHAGPRWGLGLGGFAAVAAAVIGSATLRAKQKKIVPEDIALETETYLGQDGRVV